MNKNLLSPNGFKFTLNRIPHIEYFGKTFSLPGISISAIKVNTPIKTFNVHGDSVMKESLSMTVLADEDFGGFSEIYTWIKRIAGEDGFDSHRKLVQSQEGIYSDGTLTVLNNSGNPNMEFRFERMFPISLGGLEFDAGVSDINTMTFNVSFEHDGYSIHKL